MRLSIAVIAQDLYRKQIRAEKEEASRATGQVSWQDNARATSHPSTEIPRVNIIFHIALITPLFSQSSQIEVTRVC